MKSRDFCYWLQGYFEIHGESEALSAKQVEMIKRHLSLVFVHEIDPSFGDEKEQKLLNEVHEPPKHKPPSPFGVPDPWEVPGGPKIRC